MLNTRHWRCNPSSSFTPSLFSSLKPSITITMYAHSNTAFSRAVTTMIPDPLLTLTEFDSLWQLNNSEIISYNNNNNNNNDGNSNNNKSCSSGYNNRCYGNARSPSSVASTHGFMQRSLISHYLHHHNNDSGTHHQSFSTLFANLLHSDDGPVRRVYITGDIQRTNGMQHNHNSDSPLSSECRIIIEGINRACRYSPEEKKVRIEIYRSKRNKRNFNKKIKYVCRKTLADSRPRIRGRFAKNEEIDKNPPAQWSHIGGGEEEDDEDENWVSIFDSLAAANLGPETEGASCIE